MTTLNDYTRTRSGVIEMLSVELGLYPFAESIGPNGSVLLFYGVGDHNAIVQVFPNSGWDVYVNDGQSKVQATLDWLRDLKENHASTERPSRT